MSEESKNIAVKNITQAMKSVSKKEQEYIRELQAQIDQALKTDPGMDKMLEFCYGIIFEPNKIKSELLIKSARLYISACEGKI